MGILIPSGTSAFTVSGAGLIKLTGSASVWDDLRIEPTARGGPSSPSFEKWIGSDSSKGVYLYSFTDESVVNNEKEIHFTMQMPHSWKGTPVHLHNHYIVSGTSGGRVFWGLEYSWSSLGSIYPETTLIYGDGNVPSGTILIDKKHYLAEFNEINPGSSADGISSILIGRLFRNSSNTGSDTYEGKVGLLYIDAHYEIDQMGSQDELNK
jgi:hypothetical protein